MPEMWESAMQIMQDLSALDHQRQQTESLKIASAIEQEKAAAEQAKAGREYAMQTELARIAGGTFEAATPPPVSPPAGTMVPLPAERNIQRIQSVADQFMQMGQAFMTAGDFESGRKFMKSGADMLKSGAQATEQSAADKTKQLTLTANLARSVKDQASLDRARLIAQANNIPISGLPSIYDESTAPLFEQLAESALDQKTRASMEQAIAREDRLNAQSEDLRTHRNLLRAQRDEEMALKRERLEHELAGRIGTRRGTGQPTAADMRAEYKLAYPTISATDLLIMRASDDPAEQAQAEAYSNRPDFQTWRQQTYGIRKTGAQAEDTGLDAQFEAAMGGPVVVPPNWTPPAGVAITREQLTPANLQILATQMGVSVAEVKRQLGL